MAEQSATEYCAKCRAIQPVREATEDSTPVRRCQVCGLQVGGGLVMESATLLPASKILIVDPDPQVVLMYQDILEHNNFMVLTARDGPAALEVAARERPLIILLEIRMPGMDGFEVCRRLKADPDLKNILIVILTGQADLKPNVLAFKAGAEVALRKPAEPATVLRTIQTALALAASRRS